MCHVDLNMGRVSDQKDFSPQRWDNKQLVTWFSPLNDIHEDDDNIQQTKLEIHGVLHGEAQVDP